MLEKILTFLLLVLAVNGQINIFEVPSTCKGQIRKAIFERTNYYRALHNVPSLAMSTNLTTLAQQNATSNVTIDYKGRVLPTYTSLVKPNNEIVYQSYFNSNTTSLANSTFCYEFGRNLVDSEYKIISSYNYTTFNSSGASLINGQWYDLSFKATQMIWKSTTSIGMGIGAYFYGTSQYVNLFVRTWYNPSGNIPNEYGNNVFPPK